MELPDVRPDAARLLEPVYRSLNDVRHLVEVLEVRLSGASPQDRLPLLGEISNLRETLGQKDLAFAARVRAFGEMPESPEAREELERLAAETGAFEELAAAYQDQLERGVTNATSTELWRRLAVLWSERLDRVDLAVRAYEELGRREPRNMAVLEALARIHTRAGDARELASVMKRMVMVEPSPPKQIDLLFRLGTLAEETLSDKQLAAQCYGEILARKPDDEDAIKFLGKVLTESERWPELASLIVRGDPARRLHRATRGDVRPDGPPRPAPPGAAAGPARRAGHLRGRAPPQAGARRRHRRAGGDGALGQPAARRGGRGAGAHLHLRRRPPAAGPDAGVTRLDRAGGGRSGRRCSARWPSSTPGRCRTPSWPSSRRAGRCASCRTRRRSLTLAVTLSERASNGGEELAGLLEEILPRASEETAQVATLRALGRVQEKLGHPAEAIDAWRRVLELVPSDPEAMGAPGRAVPGGGPGPRAAGDLPAAARHQRGARGPRRAALPDRRRFRTSALHDARRRHGHPPAPAGAQARRRPGAGEARSALPEAGALARAGGRHRPAAGAARRRPGPGPPYPPGGGSRDAAPRQVSARSSCTPRSSPPSRSTPARWPSWRPGPSASRRTSRWWRCCSGRTGPGASRRSSPSSSRSASAPRRTRSSASSCWSSWRGCARRRRTRRGSSARSPAPSGRTPTTPRSGPGSGRPRRRRGPTRSWRSSTRRSCPASPRRRTPPRCSSSSGR